MRLVAMALLAVLLSFPAMAASRRTSKHRGSHRTHVTAKSFRAKRTGKSVKSIKSRKHHRRVAARRAAKIHKK